VLIRRWPFCVTISGLFPRGIARKWRGKITELEEAIEELETDLDRAKKGKPPLKDSDGKVKRNQNPEALEKKIAATKQKIDRMRLDMSVKDRGLGNLKD
jgi:predicted RNase H-like nuclease (RuvC/YqgF family)